MMQWRGALQFLRPKRGGISPLLPPVAVGMTVLAVVGVGGIFVLHPRQVAVQAPPLSQAPVPRQSAAVAPLESSQVIARAAIGAEQAGTLGIAVPQLAADSPSYTGFVYDWVSGMPVDATVTQGNVVTTTDPTGKFSLSNLDAGDYELQIAATGYQLVTERFTQTEKPQVGGATRLVPALRQYVTAERDGARDIYRVDVDGTDLLRVLPAPDRGERFGLRTNAQGSFGVYTSTESGLQDAGGQTIGQAQLLDLRAQPTPSLIGGVYAYRFTPYWSENGEWVVATGYADLLLQRPRTVIYRTTDGSSASLDQQISAVSFASTSDALVYARRVGDGSSGRRSEVVRRSLSDGTEKLLYQRTQPVTSLQVLPSGDVVVGATNFDGTQSFIQVAVDGSAHDTIQQSILARIAVNGREASQLLLQSTSAGQVLVLADAADTPIRTLTKVTAAVPETLRVTGAFVQYAQQEQPGVYSWYIVGLAGGTPRKVSESVER